MADDPFLATLLDEVRADPESLGLLLHGSRATGRHRQDSDYDLIRVLTDDAYATRKAQNALLKRSPPGQTPETDTLHQSLSRLRWIAEHPDWYTATYASALVVFDRTGEVGELRETIVRAAGEAARAQIAAAYDDYLNSFVRSIKAARHGDDLGRRLHAAESIRGLIRTLYGLEGRWPPYHDMLAKSLADIEAAQDWPRSYLGDALLRLTRDGDPTFQQELEARVESLMGGRGIHHEWGNDLEPLKAFRFDESA